jgi:hypothetical protein
LKVANTTPSGIIEELQRIQAEAAKGVGALYDAEVKLADAEAKYERTLALTFMETTDGTVKDKEAIAKLKSADDKLLADLARAEYNRIKLKLKQLELAQMSTQTIARMVETELKVLR